MKKTIFYTVLLALLMGVNPGYAQDAATPAAAPTAEQIPADETASNDEARTLALQAMQKAVAEAKANIQSNPVVNGPAVPAVLKTAVERGAQIQYMGNYNGFTGWILVEKGEPSYVYVSQDEQTLFRGLMFDAQGNPVTLAHVAEAQLRNPGFFGLTADEAQSASDAQLQATANTTNVGAAQQQAAATQSGERTPGDTLYDALSVTNYFTMGSKASTAPVLYAFIDPNCPHCKDFLKSVDKEYLQSGMVQLRVIPVGILGDESRSKAAYLLSRPDPGAELMAQIRGEKALPVVPNLSLDGQDLNVDLFRLWRFDGTPIFIFKSKSDGRIMMIRGAPKDMKATVNMIAPGEGS